MARLIPSDDTAGHSQAPEARTLRRLRDGLSDQYIVYHGVHWARAGSTGAIYGEIDFIVQDRHGRLLAIEQKNTQIVVTEGDLFARYRSSVGRSTENKSVLTQVNRNLHALRSECARRHPGLQLHIEHLIYLPTATLAGPLPSSIAPGRLVDASRDAQLVEVVESLLGDAPPVATDAALADLPRIEQFLSQALGVSPDIGVLGDTSRQLTSCLSGGLSTWVGRLSLTPWRLRVQGTAGSGKTQLALEALREAASSGRLAGYVCFNRPLADAMRAIAPDAVTVTTFHELARMAGEVAGAGPVDFADPGVFDALAARFLALEGQLDGLFDTLVIDEGQDLDPQWVPALLRLVREDGRILYLEDPDQSLYGREPVRLPGWATLRSPVNYRSPRLLVEFVNWLALTDEPIEAGSAIGGFDPQWLVYPDESALLATTAQAIESLREQGYAPGRIAVLSFRGRERSRLAGPGGPDRLAGLRVRRQDGYDAQGRARWTEGDLLVDTVFRFKGQAADAVVLTEVDFAEFDEQCRRRLFVALTRARLHAVLVTSAAAERVLLARLAPQR